MSVSLHAMQCGSIEMPAGMMITGAEGVIVIPVLSYLIRHPKGDVVFDAGLGTSLNPHSHNWHRKEAQALRRDIDSVSMHCLLGDHDHLGARLEAREIEPGSVRYLIGSHLHFDHCGGFDSLPNARLIIQQREWAAGCSRDPQKFGYHSFEFDLGHDRVEVDGEHDLFGDGTITCLPTYGHTPGHQSLQITLDNRSVILTSDACYLRQALDQVDTTPKGASVDAEQMVANLRLFKRIEETGGLLLFGHDPDQWALLNDDGALRQITTGDILRAQSRQRDRTKGSRP